MKQIILIIIALTAAAFSKDAVETSKTRAQNADKPDRYVLDSLSIKSLFNPHGRFVLTVGDPDVPFVELSRNFQQEIFEFIDRESLEMKNDEN